MLGTGSACGACSIKFLQSPGSQFITLFSGSFLLHCLHLPPGSTLSSHEHVHEKVSGPFPLLRLPPSASPARPQHLPLGRQFLLRGLAFAHLLKTSWPYRGWGQRRSTVVSTENNTTTRMSNTTVNCVGVLTPVDALCPTPRGPLRAAGCRAHLGVRFRRRNTVFNPAALQ